jgi:hypothetical protein
VTFDDLTRDVTPRRMDIKARVPKRTHDSWKAKADRVGLSVNQYTKAVILERLGLLPFDFWNTLWSVAAQQKWLYGK